MRKRLDQKYPMIAFKSWLIETKNKSDATASKYAQAVRKLVEMTADDQSQMSDGIVMRGLTEGNAIASAGWNSYVEFAGPSSKVKLCKIAHKHAIDDEDCIGDPVRLHAAKIFFDCVYNLGIPKFDIVQLQVEYYSTLDSTIGLPGRIRVKINSKIFNTLIDGRTSGPIIPDEKDPERGVSFEEWGRISENAGKLVLTGKEWAQLYGETPEASYPVSEGTGQKPKHISSLPPRLNNLNLLQSSLNNTEVVED